MNETLMAAVRPSSGDKGVERCQLSYVEGVEPSKQTSINESSETHLVVKLNCKHGLYLSINSDFLLLIQVLARREQNTQALCR